MRQQRLAAAVLGAVVSMGVFPMSQAPGQDPPRAEAADNQQAEVPVKVVVLFSSGVGYFEHFGTVTGDGSTELRFKTQQINDILKSLVLQDMDGGKVTTITYPSQDPVSKTLRSFQVDITGNPSLAELLGQLRGARVTLSVGAEKVEGTILGVEKKQKPVGEGESGQVVETWVLNLITPEGIRAVELEGVGNIQLQDPELREELEKALEALAQARNQDKKPVTINFRGEGERRVRVGYVVETPIWKTSYRLIFSEEPHAENGADADNENEEKDSSPAKGKEKGQQPAQGRETGRAGPNRTPTPLAPAPDDAPAGEAAPAPVIGSAQLQGWAIVENQTDSDWNDVQLSLVSGRPISFIQDLYQPLYIPRPVVEPELYASLTPQTYDEGLGGQLPQVQLQQQHAAAQAPQGTPSQGKYGRDMQGKRQMRQQLQQMKKPGQQEKLAALADEAMDADYAGIDPSASVSSVASAGDVGELFQYTVGSVSLPRQKSAMIPIVTSPIETERMSIYNEAVLARHPLNGARVKNTSGMHLLQGPVTVLEAGTYAGDARIDDVPPGQERLISFGIDQQIRVDSTSANEESAVIAGKIVKGVLQVTYKNVYSKEYKAENKGDRDKTLLIEHHRRGGWKLVSEAEPIETTEQLYRFKGQAPAGKQTKLTVKEEIVRAEAVAILPADIGQLEHYAQTGAIPGPVKEALTEAIALKYAVVETEREIQERQNRINEVTNEQTRIRENIKTVQPNTDYYNRLTKKLDEQETQLETWRKEIETLTEQRDEQRKALEDYLAGLDVG